MSFELIEDVQGERKLIERIIRRYGNSAEHNFGYYLSSGTEDSPCVFIRSGNQGITATYSPATKLWWSIGTPLTPEGKQVSFLYDAIDYLSSKGKMNKFVIEFTRDKRKEALQKAGTRYRVHAPRYVLYWPVYQMDQWTGDQLRGGDWKKLRNMLHRVTRNYRVDTVEATTLPKEELKEVVRRWMKLRNINSTAISRKDSNRVYYESYLKIIDLEFDGCTFATAILVNGKAASITAGWDIPNQKGKYYSGIGLYDLGIPHLGEYANWSDLVMLKQAGYREVDFGGSPKPLLQFKQKFKPSTIYTTDIFSITRNTRA